MKWILVLFRKARFLLQTELFNLVILNLTFLKICSVAVIKTSCGSCYKKDERMFHSTTEKRNIVMPEFPSAKNFLFRNECWEKWKEPHKKFTVATQRVSNHGFKVLRDVSSIIQPKLSKDTRTPKRTDVLIQASEVVL